VFQEHSDIYSVRSPLILDLC